MQGLSDGYFVIPATLPAYLTTIKPGSVTTASPEFKAAEDEVKERINKLLNVKGIQDGGLLPPGTGPQSCGKTAAWPVRKKAS